ncbi:hypothetical protein AKJ35_01280 [candidate division MSBL1 archaeon SCGC-AAA833F18]|uniref:Uncharacterized protein n=1 Tax=candidate division MSBL1 archaeon SCGC-AAA833F18 TaxID=1698257 RepID=A0A133VRZ4_9EURY|nr:hypothetical protein AKJ35_01280 [candidate division MSBL1 archaeon SCGC-AAA833F18]
MEDRERPEEGILKGFYNWLRSEAPPIPGVEEGVRREDVPRLPLRDNRVFELQRPPGQQEEAGPAKAHAEEGEQEDDHPEGAGQEARLPRQPLQGQGDHPVPLAVGDERRGPPEPERGLRFPEA